MRIWQRIALGNLVFLLVLLGAVITQHRQVGSLRHDVAQATEEYEELRTLTQIREHLSLASDTLVSQAPGQARDSMAHAVELLAFFLDLQSRETAEREHRDEEAALARFAINALTEALDLPEQDMAWPTSAHSALTEASIATGALSGLMDEMVQQAHDEASAGVGRSTALLVVAATIGVVCATGVGLWQYFSVVRPLRNLRITIARLARGDLSTRAHPRGRDELAWLARDVNTMAKSLEELHRTMEIQIRDKSRELVHAERLSSVGFLSAGIAHEINNPLSIIAGYAEEARQQLDEEQDPERAEVLDVILAESARCRDIVRRLLRLAAPADPDWQSVELPVLIREIGGLLSELPRYAGRHLDMSYPPTLAVLGVREELRQVLVNLVINAFEATDAGGRVSIEATRHGDRAMLDVTDNGVGMTPETLAHLFDPFYSTRRGHGGTGTGLGLSVSYAIVEAHGGTLSASSPGPGCGSRLRMALPLANGGGA